MINGRDAKRGAAKDPTVDCLKTKLVMLLQARQCMFQKLLSHEEEQVDQKAALNSDCRMVLTGSSLHFFFLH